MKDRCTNVNNKSFKNYGGRGISFTPSWSQFEPFKEWALVHGYKENLTIDRVDINGNYEPSNCRWVNRKVQANNKRTNLIVTLNGVSKTFQQWCDEKRINSNTVRSRIRKFGYTIEEALSTPVKPHFIDLEGKRFGRLTVVELAENKTKHRGIYWKCLCDCGSYTVVRSSSLVEGKTKSCGCLLSDSGKYKAEHYKRNNNGTFSHQQ